GRNDHTRSLRSPTTIIPAINPVRHLTRTLEHPSVTQSSRMLQEQIHCIEGHSIDEDRMLEMVCGEHAEQLLGSADAEGGHQHGPATLHDLRNLLDKLLLKPIPDRMILHRIRSFHNYRVQVLVLWIRAIDEPSRLTVEIASVEDPLPVTLNDCLSAARNMPGLYQRHRAVANIGRLLVLKIPLMLEHSLQINVLVGCIVAA